MKPMIGTSTDFDTWRAQQEVTIYLKGKSFLDRHCFAKPKHFELFPVLKPGKVHPAGEWLTPEVCFEAFRELTRIAMQTAECHPPAGTHGPIVFEEPTGSVGRLDRWLELPVSSSISGGQLAFPEELRKVMNPTDGATGVAPEIRKVDFWQPPAPEVIEF